MHKTISKISERMEMLQDLLPQDLGVHKRLSMDLELRKEVMGEEREKLKWPFIPYRKTIHNLDKIRGIESLICKLEYVYRLFTKVLTVELQAFWQEEEYFSQDKLFIDADSLKGILIYVLVKSKAAKLIVDVSKFILLTKYPFF